MAWDHLRRQAGELVNVLWKNLKAEHFRQDLAELIPKCEDREGSGDPRDDTDRADDAALVHEEPHNLPRTGPQRL